MGWSSLGSRYAGITLNSFIYLNNFQGSSPDKMSLAPSLNFHVGHLVLSLHQQYQTQQHNSSISYYSIGVQFLWNYEDRAECQVETVFSDSDVQ